MLSYERVVRLIERGAVVIVQDNVGRLYRTEDARRSEVGRVALERVKSLISDGVLQASGSDSNRYRWTGRQDKSAGDLRVNRDILDDPATDPTPGMPPRLRRLLRFERNASQRSRLIKAVMRFCADMDMANRGGKLTMSWDFVPRGKTRQTAGAQNVTGVGARRAMNLLNEKLGTDTVHFLSQVLILEKTAQKICHDTGLSRRVFRRVLEAAVNDLADAYDLLIPANDRS